MFVDLNPDSEKIIYSHFTCATGKLLLCPPCFDGKEDEEEEDDIAVLIRT